MSRKKVAARTSKQVNVFDVFETDADACRDGRWCDIVFGGESVGRVKVRPADDSLNPEYRAGVLRLAQKVDAARKEHGEQIPDDVDRRLIVELYAETVIAGWELAGPDGPLPFNEATVIDTMLRAPKLFDLVRRQAKDWASYRRAFEADALKT